MESFKKFSPVLYVLIVFCFLLPFYNLSCGGQKVMSLTGFQIVTGIEYVQPNMFGGVGKTTKIEPEPLAIYALLIAIVGLIIVFIKVKSIGLISGILSIVGAVFLFLLKNKLDSNVIAQGQGMIKIEYEFGYWLALLLFVVSTVIQGLVYNQENKMSTSKIESTSAV